MAVLEQLAPGGTLAWTITGSGLDGISDLRLLDDLGDGQRMDTAFRPQVVIRRGSATLFSGELLGWSGVRSSETAVTAIDFNLAPTLRAAGLPGGLTDDSTVEVTFHSRILSLYAARASPPLGRLLGQGDPLRNAVRFSGTVGGSLVGSESTLAQVALPSSALTTSIFAVNGVRATGAAHAAFGDIVTYRMQLQMPLTAAHQVQLVAGAAGLDGLFVFDAAGVDAAPRSLHAQFGPDGSYTATQPLLTSATDAAGRAVLRFDFGDVQPVYGNGPGTIDLPFSAPLTPGAPLVFRATETELNSFGAETTTTPPQSGLALDEPALRIQTATLYASNDHATWTGTGGPFGYSPDFGQFGGVISSAGLAIEPFADRLSGVDAGDEVTFVIAVENTMAGATAYGVVLRDRLPDGFAVPDEGLSIVVTDGMGTPLAWSGDLFDAAGGLTLGEPLAGYDADSGLNMLLITYTLRSADRLDLASPVRGNSAQIVRYATRPGSGNRVPANPASDATAGTEVVALPHAVAIALTATSLPNTAGALLALGETATFLLTATLAEGLSRGLVLTPVLPVGFIAVAARVVSLGANITAQQQVADGAGGIAFGDTVNQPDGLDTDADLVRIEVTVRPSLTPAGPAPHGAGVQAAISVGAPGQPRTTWTATSPVQVTVADPITPTISMSSAGATLRNGEPVTFTATVTLPIGTSAAFRIVDTLPAGMDYVPGSVRIVQAGGVTTGRAAELAAPMVLVAGRLLTLDFGEVTAPAGAIRQVTIELQARVSAAVGQDLINSVVAETGYASSLAATSVTQVANTAPTVTGVAASFAARDDTVLAPFATIAIADPDESQLLTLRVTVGSPANGALTNLGGGHYDAASGEYALTSSAAEVAAAAAALRFVPTRRQAGLGQQVNTEIELSVQDSVGASSPAMVVHVATTIANTAPVLRNAAPCRVALPGTPVPLFTGLFLQDADPDQIETLTIQLTDPSAGMLTGADPGHYDPATGRFTATGTLDALSEEAGRLVFTASTGTSAATELTVTIDDRAGGVARDTSLIALSSAALPGPTGPLFVGITQSAHPVIVDPAGPGLLVGASGRDAFFLDGNATAAQLHTVTGFGDGDCIVLWGFEPERSSVTWSDDDGLPGQTGRTLRANIPGAGAPTISLTFVGQLTDDTDRFAISTGRVGGLDYLLIVSPT